MPRQPKNPETFIHPLLAGMRLLGFAQDIMLRRRGVRVRWRLKVEYLYTADFDPGKALALPMGGTVSSGPNDDRAEVSLTGHAPPYPTKDEEEQDDGEQPNEGQSEQEAL